MNFELCFKGNLGGEKPQEFEFLLIFKSMIYRLVLVTAKCPAKSCENSNEESGKESSEESGEEPKRIRKFLGSDY